MGAKRVQRTYPVFLRESLGCPRVVSKGRWSGNRICLFSARLTASQPWQHPTSCKPARFVSTCAWQAAMESGLIDTRIGLGRASPAAPGFTLGRTAGGASEAACVPAQQPQSYELEFQDPISLTRQFFTCPLGPVNTTMAFAGGEPRRTLRSSRRTRFRFGHRRLPAWRQSC